MNSQKLVLPSDDIPSRIVRSPHCPNRRSVDPTCGTCAWGFYTKQGAGIGEDAQLLSLQPLNAGYKSQCGKVELFADDQGRIGALREEKFFPGIPGNEAYECYIAEHPELAK